MFPLVPGGEFKAQNGLSAHLVHTGEVIFLLVVR
jgi:hypothetical protein